MTPPGGCFCSVQVQQYPWFRLVARFRGTRGNQGELPPDSPWFPLVARCCAAPCWTLCSTAAAVLLRSAPSGSIGGSSALQPDPPSDPLIQRRSERFRDTVCVVLCVSPEGSCESSSFQSSSPFSPTSPMLLQVTTMKSRKHPVRQRRDVTVFTSW